MNKKASVPAMVFILFMSLIYLYNMFVNKPWYDELYTYYYFISRGPVYAAIHWPVPNNHVGYSVVSAFLNLFTDSYIGLRGISCFAAIANLILIYRLCCKFMNGFYGLTAMALYGGSFLVFRLAFQGRGYTLSTTCLLVAALCVCQIAFGDLKFRNYAIFAISLTFGLYIVPSSIYWVIPVCVSGGLYLLVQKRYKDLFHLIFSGIAAAFMTLFLYLLIWLAIGANLLCKDPTGSFYGLSQVTVILKAPFKAASTGIDYMLASPYIQSIDRVECIKTMPEYFISLFSNYYDKGGTLLLILYLIVTIASVILTIQKMQQRQNYFLSLFIVTGLVLVPCMLIIQSVHPYLRVLSFLSVFLFIGTVYVIYSFVKWPKAGLLAAGASLLLCVLSCISPYYNSPLASRENEILNVISLIPDPTDINNIFFTDDFQKYVIKFYYGYEPTEAYTLESADYVITGPEFSDPSYTNIEWPVLYGYSEEMISIINENMTNIASTNTYSVYKRQ